jgi:ATP-independent RNA helicase DbpA
MNPFSTLPLSAPLIATLESLGYEAMTPIQEAALPHVLDGDDLIAMAKTGSGKTAAFGIGILEKLDVSNFKPQSLVLCPTRELADQVAKELRKIARFTQNIKILTLCGGTAFGPQIGSLAHGAHIVVGTPGRVLKHLQKGTLELGNLKTLVLDEADRMLDMGFLEEVEKVIAFAASPRQTLLFSATFPEDIIALSQKIQHEPKRVEVKAKDNPVIEHFYEVSQKTKGLLAVLATHKPKNAIVFVNTKAETGVVAEYLLNHNVDALALHGDLEQYERNDVLVQFGNHSCAVLVATEVAARGLDIKDLEMVVNYDLPFSLESYTHRIGRTARAGAEGLAVSLYLPHEYERAALFEADFRHFADEKSLHVKPGFTLRPPFRTLVIEGGKKDKLRPGDILGALTGDMGLEAKDVGKIDIYEKQSYVAITKERIEKIAKKPFKIKGKTLPSWAL